MVGPACKRDNGFRWRLASFVQFRLTATELMAKVKVNGALLHLLMLIIIGLTVVVEASTTTTGDSSPNNKNGLVPAANGNIFGCGVV